jgi:hypothetical protein
MRGVTIAVIGGAAVVLLAIMLFMGGGDEAPAPGQATKLSPDARSRSGAAPAGDSRSSRVEDRLGTLRAEYERRQAESAPAASQREVPTASQKSERMRQAAEEQVVAEEESDDDPEEIAEARETLFNNEDPDERIGAILMLTGSEGPESMRLLMEAMDDPDAEVRLAVVEALGDRVEEISPGLLDKPLRDPDPEVRFEAVSVLGDMENNSEALELVRSATEDPDEDVKALAEGIMDFTEDEDDAADNGK